MLLYTNRRIDLISLVLLKIIAPEEHGQHFIQRHRRVCRSKCRDADQKRESSNGLEVQEPAMPCELLLGVAVERKRRALVQLL